MAEINNEKVIKIPEKNEKLAELIGILLGDENICKYKHKTKKNCIYEIRVSGHSENDFIYLNNYVSNLIFELFEIKPYVYKSKVCKAMHICFRSIRLVKFLESIGMQAGNKKSNQVRIPSWIFENESFMKACIRGLIDTDGCVYMCGNGSNFPRINFCSNIRSLQKDFDSIMSLLGYNNTPWNGKNTMIYRKKDIFKYKNEIDFSNLYHRNKFDRLSSCSVARSSTLASPA